MLAHVRQLILNAPSAKEREQGFAIVFSLILVSFVVLLLLSLVTFVQIETRIADQTLQNAKARQNALWALNLALGELQKHTGPDQRVTAKADINLPGAEIIEDEDATFATMSGEDALNVINSYWHDRRNRHWTGVWLDPDPYKNNFDKDDLPASNPDPQLQRWLVSQDPDRIMEPTAQLSGLDVTTKPQDRLTIVGANGDVPARMLVGPNTDASLSTSEKLSRVVTAPEIAIPGAGEDAAPNGHFAWWVGDEGVKIRGNLRDPYDFSGATAEEVVFRRQSAQRFALEAMTGSNSGSGYLSTFNQANDPILDSLITPNQLSFLDSLTPEQVDRSFHDITTYSWGVLSDVRHGGLKYDLTRLLSVDDVDTFRNAIGTIFDTSMDSNYNNFFDEEFTVYATLPSESDHAGGPEKDRLGTGKFLTVGPTWEQLYSYYNLKNSISTSGSAGVFEAPNVVAFRDGSATEQAIYPLVTHAKVWYRLEVRGDEIWIGAAPFVVLANPYNVDIKGSVEVVITQADEGSIRVVHLAPKDSEAEPPSHPHPTEFNDLKESNLKKRGSTHDYVGLNRFKLVINDTLIPAGEALVYMVKSPVSNTAAVNTIEEVEMDNNLYHPDSARVWLNTGYTLSEVPEATHVKLRANGLSASAYVKIIENGVSQPNRYGMVAGKKPWPTNTEGVQQSDDIVYPTNDSRSGAGFIVTRQDPIAQSAALYGSQKMQQALYSQFNFRAYSTGPLGSSGPNIHFPGKVYIRPGDAQNEERFEDHLMFGPDSNNKNVRWGVVHNGKWNNPTSAPPPVDSTSLAKVLLYDIPRDDHPLASLGQLQHMNMSGIPTHNPKEEHSKYAFQVNYPISNSYPDPRVRRDKTLDARKHWGPHVDISYIMNQMLWDRFYFSSYPQTGNFDFENDDLINSRYRPFRINEGVDADDPQNFRGPGGDVVEDSLMASQNLMSKGAFNVNSTSVEAWKAVLSSLRGVPTGAETSPGNLTAPFGRTLFQIGGSDGAMDPTTTNAWEGFINLDQDQIDRIAEEMVFQVMKRGPFMSMADFVNRKLMYQNEDTYDLGLAGALQAAIDKVINQEDAASEAAYNAKSAEPLGFGNFWEEDYLMPSALSGFPGYLMQGDVLSSIGSALEARSDTFTIRTYGDATNPVSGETVAQAWCEVVVQRYPDYVNAGADAPHELPDDLTNQKLGRKYKILSFRWLDASDI